MTIHRPTLAIVTICFNSEKYIGDTLKSVAEQTLPPNEFVVVDGGSSDATLEIVTNYAGTVTKVISEPDNGISDAMNKGIAHTNSDYILFLHSDDYLAKPNVLEKAQRFTQTKKDIYGFSVCFQTQDGEKIINSRGFGFWTNFKTGIAHQGVLCHRRVFENVGRFENGLKVAMDYDFFLRAKRAKFDFTSCPMLVLSVMRDTGVSSRTDWQSLRQRFQEEKSIHSDHCPNLILRMMYWIWWMVYPCYRWIKHQVKERSN